MNDNETKHYTIKKEHIIIVLTPDSEHIYYIT